MSMNIVQVIPSFNVGGGELLAVRLCAEIIKQRPDYKVTLISLYDPIPSIVYDEALASGAQIVTLGKRKGFDPFTPLRMLKALRAIKPDVIHTHLAGLRYTLLAGVLGNYSLKVHTVHNLATHETFGFLKHVHRVAFKFISWIPVSLSKEVQDSVRDMYCLESVIVNNGIKTNSEIINKSKDDIRKHYGLPLNRKIIITIGRLCIQKNQLLLIDAFNEVCKNANNYTLLIVGEDNLNGSYKHKIDRKISELPDITRENLHLLGPRKDIPELLIASDVFVLSSDWEGVPLTLLEAMGYGTPVVCTSVGGIPDVIEHGFDGLLVSKGDSKSLGNAIVEVLSNNSFASSLVQNARKKFSQLYSIEMTAEKYMQLYNA